MFFPIPHMREAIGEQPLGKIDYHILKFEDMVGLNSRNKTHSLKIQNVNLRTIISSI